MRQYTWFAYALAGVLLALGASPTTGQDAGSGAAPKQPAAGAAPPKPAAAVKQPAAPAKPNQGSQPNQNEAQTQFTIRTNEPEPPRHGRETVLGSELPPLEGAWQWKPESVTLAGKDFVGCGRPHPERGRTVAFDVSGYDTFAAVVGIPAKAGVPVTRKTVTLLADGKLLKSIEVDADHPLRLMCPLRGAKSLTLTVPPVGEGDDGVVFAAPTLIDGGQPCHDVIAWWNEVYVPWWRKGGTQSGDEQILREKLQTELDRANPGATHVVVLRSEMPKEHSWKDWARVSAAVIAIPGQGVKPMVALNAVFPTRGKVAVVLENDFRATGPQFAMLTRDQRVRAWSRLTGSRNLLSRANVILGFTTSALSEKAPNDQRTNLGTGYFLGLASEVVPDFSVTLGATIHESESKKLMLRIPSVGVSLDTSIIADLFK